MIAITALFIHRVTAETDASVVGVRVRACCVCVCLNECVCEAKWPVINFTDTRTDSHKAQKTHITYSK